MNAIARIPQDELAKAPRVWRDNGRGVRVRVFDPKWLERQQRRYEAKSEPLVVSEPPSELTEIAQLSAAVQELQEKLALLAEREARRESEWKHRPVHSVVRRFSRFSGLSIAEITGCGRRNYVTAIRQTIMYWAVRRGASTTLVGKVLGDRDHTTVIHGCRAHVKRRAKQGRYLRPVVGSKE